MNRAHRAPRPSCAAGSVLLPLPVLPRRHRVRTRVWRSIGRHQERHRQRRVLPGSLPGHAADARRPDDRGPRPGGGGVAARSRRTAPSTARVWLRGVDNAKFRRQVVPGDRLRLEVQLGRVRSRLAKVRAIAFVDEQPVAEADLLLGIETGAAYVRSNGSGPSSGANRRGYHGRALLHHRTGSRHRGAVSDWCVGGHRRLDRDW